MVIAEPGDEDGVGDDEGLLDLLNVRKERHIETSTFLLI